MFLRFFLPKSDCSKTQLPPLERNLSCVRTIRPGSFNNRFRNCVAQFSMNRENYNLTPTNFKVNRRVIEQKSLSLLLTSKQSTSYFRKRKVKMKECEGDRRSSPILVINELVPRATRLNLYHVIKKRRALGTRMKFPVPPLG